MKELLIVSTYGQEAARDWYKIQKRFIEQHTPDFDFGVYLHEVKNERRFSNDIVIGRTEGELLYALPEMFFQIYQYFKTHEYKNYLILDSDAFPVKDDWYPNLLKIMGDKWYAAPVRTDNLDTVPHPCALFMRGEYVHEHVLSFRRGNHPKINLMGDEVVDIGTGFKMDNFYPLMRSNFINVHPMVGAIYGDTFYHHGAGSRKPFFRSTDYWKNVSTDHYNAGEMCYEWLKDDPEKYVGKMRGEGIVDSPESLKRFMNV